MATDLLKQIAELTRLLQQCHDSRPHVPIIKVPVSHPPSQAEIAKMPIMEGEQK